MNFNSFAAAGAFFGGLALETARGHHHALERAAVIVEGEAKRVIGTYEYGWPQLADSTQKDRVAKGFSANDPLLRSGGLRDSVEHTTTDDRAYVGSDSQIAEWQELGTSKIPARSFLMSAAIHKEAEVRELLGREVMKQMTKW